MEGSFFHFLEIRFGFGDYVCVSNGFLFGDIVIIFFFFISDSFDYVFQCIVFCSFGGLSMVPGATLHMLSCTPGGCTCVR